MNKGGKGIFYPPVKFVLPFVVGILCSKYLTRFGSYYLTVRYSSIHHQVHYDKLTVAALNFRSLRSRVTFLKIFWKKVKHSTI